MLHGLLVVLTTVKNKMATTKTMAILLEDQPYQRCDTLTQQDYIHSCGVLFASEAFFFEHRQLQRQFRASYGAGYGVLNRADYWFRYRGFQYCLKGLNPDEHTVLDGLLL